MSAPRPDPRPIPRTLFDDEVDTHRALDCPHYSDCNDRAVLEKWRSWSCAGCPMGGLPPAELSDVPLAVGWAEPRHGQVLAVVRAAGGPIGMDRICERLPGHDRSEVGKAIAQYMSRGRIVRVADRVYATPETHTRSVERQPPLTDRAARLLDGDGRVWTGQEVAEALRVTHRRACRALQQLAMLGRAVRVSPGTYRRAS